MADESMTGEREVLKNRILDALHMSKAGRRVEWHPQEVGGWDDVAEDVLDALGLEPFMRDGKPLMVGKAHGSTTYYDADPEHYEQAWRIAPRSGSRPDPTCGGCSAYERGTRPYPCTTHSDRTEESSSGG